MQWEFVVALIIAVPIILFPAAFVWYLNVGGIYAAIKKARAKRAERIASGAEVEHLPVAHLGEEAERIESQNNN